MPQVIATGQELPELPILPIFGWQAGMRAPPVTEMAELPK
jgi:hypothetical protein